MTSRSVLGLLAVVAVGACGGHGGGATPGAVPPAASATGAVQEFMAGVADSNIIRIGSAWGTSKGAAAVLGQPADWEKRVTVMQLWLRGGTYTITGDQSLVNDQTHRQVTMDLVRGGCTKTIPITVVKVKHGWLVESIDLTAAGNPEKPCAPSSSN
ncbi:MAG TPA: hypothetical protein VFI39_07375 [Gemmatimonadales bacterium]|nr:hypothetical protein [Gemmatimonadales bacterium]